MKNYSEQEIRAFVTSLIQERGVLERCCAERDTVPVEISARHVHLDQAALDMLFGKNYALTPKRLLSQPGQYLAEERLKVVTAAGTIDHVAILGPVRRAIQVELSMTDARALGLRPPIRLSGDLRGGQDVVLIGPAGAVAAKGVAIVAKAHVHMTPENAASYGVRDGEAVCIRLGTVRPVTLEDVIVRVSRDFSLAVHIDFDEANAAGLSGSDIRGQLKKGGGAR